MLRIAALLLLLPVAGCVSRPDPNEDAVPFVFRALNLREQDKQGRPAWRVTSPEARYDINRRLATATNPSGLIYAEGEPRYELHAQRATVINDGEVIQLEGAVTIRRLGARPVLVEAERLRWYPARAWIDIEHRPRIREGLTRVRAGLASIDLKQEAVQLRQNPVFERWSDGVQQGSPPPLTLKATQADWLLGSGAWTAQGPIRGEQRQPGQTSPRVLTATAMRGNSRQDILDLLAPVHLSDPGRKTTIAAQVTRVDLAAQRISTDQPVQATIGALAVQGARLQVDLRSTLATIPVDCLLQQPGLQLQAGVCRWNWTTRQVWAEHDVILRRPAQGQITRSQALSGSLGPQGQVVFFSPGGRVESQVRVTGSRSGGSPRPRPAIVP